MERPRDKAPIFLGGFMASGKTSVGRELSRMTGYPFLDMDETIEKRTGLSVSEIFIRQGEDAFRRMEGELLREAALLANCIVALGGGVLVDEKNRELVEERGTLVILGVEPYTVRKRTAGQPGLRPLLENNDLDALWAKRLAFYQGGRLRLETDSLSPEEVARKIQETLSLPSSGTGQRVFEGSFGQVVVGADILDRLPSFLENGRIPFVVADTLTGPLFGGSWAKRAACTCFPAGKRRKHWTRSKNSTGPWQLPGWTAREPLRPWGEEPSGTPRGSRQPRGSAASAWFSVPPRSWPRLTAPSEARWA
jgi:Shikimate kinase